MEMKLEEDEDESRSCCADEEELDRKEMTKRGLKNGIFDDSLDDFSATALKRYGSRTNGNFCLDVGVQRWYRLFSSGYQSMLIEEQMRSLLSLWGGSHNEKESAIGFLEAWKIPGVAPFAVSVEYLRKDQRCQDKVEDENGVRNYYLHSAPIFAISGLFLHAVLSLIFSLCHCLSTLSLIPRSLNIFLVRLCHLAILCLDQHAHTLHHLESLLTISLDRLDILKEDLVYQSLQNLCHCLSTLSLIPRSLNIFLVRLCHLAILCLDQHAHTLHHLESLLTISLDRLDILKEDLVYQSLQKSLSLNELELS
ncbi:hypothetical protein Tco_1262213 [Tanacetum coccineum]